MPHMCVLRGRIVSGGARPRQRASHCQFCDSSVLSFLGIAGCVFDEEKRKIYTGQFEFSTRGFFTTPDRLTSLVTGGPPRLGACALAVIFLSICSRTILLDGRIREKLLGRLCPYLCRYDTGFSSPLTGCRRD